MPVLAAPAYLLAALAASAVVVALHLWGWRRPPAVPLPTARFVPPSAVRALSPEVRPSDLVLLALRVLALLLAGAALARPAVAPRRAGDARVIVVDASRRVGRMAEAMDSARAHAAGADAVSWIRVDSAAWTAGDSAVGERGEVRGRLGSGLVAAIREAHRLAATHGRVAIVVVSPFAAESWDEGVEAMRGSWGGALVPVRVAARKAEGPRAGEGERVLPPPGDPIGAAFARALDASAPRLRVRRTPPTADDSAWARAGGLVVSWPAEGAGDATGAPAARPGAAGAPGAALVLPNDILATGAVTAAGHLGRARVALPRGVTVLRWGDGTPAATEAALGLGCIRTVGVTVPTAGDEVLRPAFLRLVRALAGACGGGSEALVDGATLARWASGAAGGGAERPAEAGARVDGAPGVEVRPPHAGSDAAQRWLLVAAGVALLAEWWVRRRRGDGADDAPPRTVGAPQGGA